LHRFSLNLYLHHCVAPCIEHNIVLPEDLAGLDPASKYSRARRDQSMLRFGSIDFITLFAFFIAIGRDFLDIMMKPYVPELKVHSERMP
jgi:hypothetical protein